MAMFESICVYHENSSHRGAYDTNQSPSRWNEFAFSHAHSDHIALHPDTLDTHCGIHTRGDQGVPQRGMAGLSLHCFTGLLDGV